MEAYPFEPVPMPVRKRIALIAHDNCKTGLLDWARYNRHTLAQHESTRPEPPARCSRPSCRCR